MCKDLSSPDVDLSDVIERAGAGGVIRNVSIFSLIVERFISSSGASTAAAQLCLVQKKKMLLYYWHKTYFKELKEIIIDDIPKAGNPLRSFFAVPYYNIFVGSLLVKF